MWHMYNFNEQISIPSLYDSQSFYSTIYRAEYNCASQESRNLESHSFSEKNGLGSNVGGFKKSNDEWTAYQPNTVSEDLWKIACGKYFKK